MPVSVQQVILRSCVGTEKEDPVAQKAPHSFRSPAEKEPHRGPCSSVSTAPSSDPNSAAGSSTPPATNDDATATKDASMDISDMYGTLRGLDDNSFSLHTKILTDRIQTLVIRQMPNKFKSCDVLDALDTGFLEKIAFFHIPLHNKTGNNMGFAFVHFKSPIDAAQFACLFDGTPLVNGDAKKSAQVAISQTQGVLATVSKIRTGDALLRQDGQLVCLNVWDVAMLNSQDQSEPLVQAAMAYERSR